VLGGLLEASLIIVIFIVAFFNILWICRRRRVNRRRVRWGCSSHATIVKAKVAKARIAVPLLHRSFFIKSSNPFLEGLNFWAFFTLTNNGGARGLQVQMSAYLFHWFGNFPSFTPLMLRLYIYGMLGLAHPKQQTKKIRIGDGGLSLGCPLPVAALGGEECGAAAIDSSTGALKSFLICKGWCSFSQKNARAVTLSIICMR
jgi:hypothetical protein